MTAYSVPVYFQVDAETPEEARAIDIVDAARWPEPEDGTASPVTVIAVAHEHEIVPA